MAWLDAPKRLPVHLPRGWAMRLVANPGFQRWAARFPLTRHFVRRDGARIFDLVQGFVQSQALVAIVELRLLHHLADGPLSVDNLAGRTAIPLDSMNILAQAGAAMGLLVRRRDRRIALGRRGAAILGVPGLEQMILHHRVLYRDLSDPVAFLRGENESEMATFWPYVFGPAAQSDLDAARAYSRLMADSQTLVAADTLDLVDLAGTRRLLDVGGGSGVFLAELALRYPTIELDLFDLPEVVATAGSRRWAAGVAERISIHAGSFRTDPLPAGADAVSLVRVLYDHQDETVRALLRKVHDILPAGGRLLIAEPMSGGDRPDPATDVFFAFYTKAMGTGRTRSAAEIIALCAEAGFTGLRAVRPRRSFVTSVVTGRRAS